EAEQPDEIAQARPFPDGVELAPARDAVDIRMDFRRGDLAELVPGPARFLFDFAEHSQRPGRRIDGGHRAIVQHREFERQRLAGREASLGLHALFFVAAELEIVGHGVSSLVITTSIARYTTLAPG